MLICDNMRFLYTAKQCVFKSLSSPTWNPMTMYVYSYLDRTMAKLFHSVQDELGILQKEPHWKVEAEAAMAAMDDFEEEEKID